MVDKPPTQDAIMQAGVRKWETPEHRPNMTLTRAAYKPYSTLVLPNALYSLQNIKTNIFRIYSVKPKYSAWEPVAAPR